MIGWRLPIIAKEGFVADNPVAHLKKPRVEHKVVQALSHSEIARLLNSCSDIHSFEIDEAKVREVAATHGLLLLSNSDAHYVSSIGRYYNEISLEELYARAR